MSARTDLASAFGVAEDDPRLDTFIQRASAKGYDPGEWAAYAAGKSEAAPVRRNAGPTPEGQSWTSRVANSTGALPPEPGPSFGDRARGALDTAGAFMKGVNDKFTVGLWPLAERLMGTQEGSEAMAARSPTAHELGEGTGMGLSAVAGPAALATQATSRTVGALAPALAGQVQGRLGSALAGNMATAYAERGDIEDAAASGLGTIAGTAVGEALGKGARVIKNTRGARARELIESHGGRVGMGSSGKGGVFDRELAGRQPIDKDIGAVSRESSARVLNRMESDLADDLASPVAAKGALDAGPQQMVQVDDLANHLKALAASERLTTSEQSAVTDWLTRLSRYETAPGSGRYVMPANKLNDFRGMLSDSTGVGDVPGTVAKAKMQGATGAARQAVGSTAYAPVNEEISAAKTLYEQNRRLLGLADKPAGGKVAPESPPGRELSESEVAYLANLMSREEQNTVTAGVRNADRTKELARVAPQHRADIELPRVLEAKGDLQFKLSPGERHGLIERTKGALQGPALAAGGAYAVAKAAGIDPEVAAAVIGGAKLGSDLLKLNAPAITGRLLYQPAQAAGAISATAAARPSLFEMLRQAQDLNRERARKVRAATGGSR